MADESKLTLLTTCADSGEAGALRSRLEAEGIPAVVQGEHHHAMLGAIYGSVIEVRVLVPEAALGRAKALLASWEATDTADTAENASEERENGHPRCADHGGPSIGTCIRCGAFVCEACVGGATEELLCPSCDARAGEVEAPRHWNTRRTVATLILAGLALPFLIAILYAVVETMTER
ncbi:MAG TPA: DUF2007 domain-containing protein [Myxococcales bacterium]|nr:DUF2007 domain-containing protein [Myxococcales bacterium]